MARRVNKELEKLKHVQYHIDDEIHDDTVSELVHYFAMKHGRKLLMVNHGKERVEVNFERLDEALKYLGQTGGIHDRFKFYPCMSDKIRKHYDGNKEETMTFDRGRRVIDRDNDEQEITTKDDIMFLERLINSNNRAKGVMTKDILEYAFKPNAEFYFVEFIKLMCYTYRKNGFDKELLKLYDEHIKDYNFLINNEEDIAWLRNYKNQRRLYNFLAVGGTIYQKGNAVDTFKSFFYDRNEIPAELAEISDTIEWNEDFGIKPLPLSMDTIRNLIDYGYINKNHLHIKYRTLLDRKFYIPKKKRRKRIYIEDAKYITLSDDSIQLTDKRYVTGSYDEGVMKLTRDKKVRKKRYIPTVKNSNWVRVYHINKLIENGKELYEEMVNRIEKVDAVKEVIYFPEHWEV